MRPKAIITLLESVREQTLYPDEIIIVDGSTNELTTKAIEEGKYKNLQYFKVTDKDRGLTKQRNFGIRKVEEETEVISFLDDDTLLEQDYFEELIKTFTLDTSIGGVGGVAINENRWKKIEDPNKYYPPKHFFKLNGYVVEEGLRNVARNYLGLQSNLLPGLMPEYSNGRTCGYPLDGNTYEVDLLTGLSFAFHKKVFKQIKFSTYFEGYGLYEDADYSIRALAYGKNVINTKVKLKHFHEPEGRPNKFSYGKMVVRNGWYVWRIKYPNPSLKGRLKWNAIVLLLTGIRFMNVINTKKRKEAFTDALGRVVGMLSLLINKP